MVDSNPLQPVGVPFLGAADGLPDSSHIVLRLRNISKTFGGARALKDVNLTLRAGAVLCLLGENGAGKSTLAQVLAGAIQADSGSIEMDGEAVSIANPTDAHELGIRLVPQELMLCQELSVAENVCLGHWPQRRKLINRRAMRAEAAKRLGALGLDHLDLDAPVSSLPVVDQAFVQISRAMTPGARVLITDEPTAPMGADQAERLLNLLASITQQGVAIVFVSHRLDEVFRLGHDVVVLRDGEKVAEESVASVTKDQLASAMLGTRELGQDQRQVTSQSANGAAALSVRGLTGADLEAVSMDVRAGEVVAVYGSAGSGRDQLGRLIFGSSPRLAGRVIVAGKELTRVSPRASIAAGIGYVPAERRSQGLILDASIRENLVLASMAQLSSNGLMRRRAERELTRDWMARLHLAARSPETPVASLSGGNQQKVLLARWLSRRPPILILDEPTRGVDVGTKADIYSMLWQAAAQGAAVIVISSDIEEVARVADRVIVLRGGRVTSQLGRVSQQKILTAAMGVSAHV